VPSSFFTLSRKAEFIYKDRGSKFIGLTFSIGKEEEVKACLEEAKKRYPAARHYCYAWRLGGDGLQQRSNDDGEPSGSAGRPILGQLISSDVTDALVIVVRYFGGTLLGVGGLMQAYKSAASGAIAESGIEERHVMVKYEASFTGEDTSAVMRVLKTFEVQIESTGYDSMSSIIFYVKEMHRPALESNFAELYRVILKPMAAQTI
jgi:uncharacterized YigZ family protein